MFQLSKAKRPDQKEALKQLGGHLAVLGGFLLCMAVQQPTAFQRFAWSGNKRHVLLGTIGFCALAAVPLLFSSGKKKTSETADMKDDARNARLKT
eukprot:jgi/Chlat1/5366/Chrsp35S05294